MEKEKIKICEGVYDSSDYYNSLDEALNDYKPQIEKIQERLKPAVDAFKAANKDAEVVYIALENGKGCALKKDIPYTTAKKCMNYMVSTSEDRGIADMGELILEDCWICGDQDLLSPTKERLSASMQAAQLFEMYQGEIKKN